MTNATIRTLALLTALCACACSDPEDISYLSELVDGGADAHASEPIDADVQEPPAPCASTVLPDASIGSVCSVGEGACERAGQYVCEHEKLVCSAEPGTPGPELCDTERDEDCDGQVDEGSSEGCCTDADCGDVELCKRPADDAFAPGACTWPGDENADCERKGGEVVCTCKPGYDGDGQRCERNYCERLHEDDEAPCGAHQSCKSLLTEAEQGPSCSCKPSFGDCDDDPDNGCEVDLRSSGEHCGACGLACGDGLSCEDSSCGAHVSTIVLAYSAGYALTPSGGVLGSGYSELLSGQNTTTPEFGALGIDDAADISVNLHHACVLHKNGEVSCGGNSSTGIAIGGSEPAQTTAMLGVSGIRAIAVGETYTCLVDEGGYVYCWGQGTAGQFGDGLPRSGDGATRTLAAALEDEQRVSYVSGAVDVKAGNRMTCALTDEQRVYCWGYEDSAVYAPELVGNGPDEPLQDAEQICTGSAHGCALRSDKSVVCWGSDEYGQLGSDEAPAGRSRYVQVDLEDVVSLACGYGHSCAVVENGEAYCWGFGTQGQLGTGAAANADTPAPVSLPGLAPARTVHAGSGAMSSCVELVSGDVYCFGFNYYGQLGLGAAAKSSLIAAPTLVTGWP